MPVNARSTFSYAFLLAVLPACGGGGGDPQAIPAANPYGSDQRLSEVLGEATWEDDANMSSTDCKGVPQDESVQLSGLTIAAIDTFDETGEGQSGNYYVQDSSEDPPPFSGITVFSPSFSPPDLHLSNLDVVDLIGSKTEFQGPSSSPFSFCRTLPEISGTMSFRFDGTRELEPKVVPLADLVVYEKARQWLGMLIAVENVVIRAPTNSKGRYTAAIDNAPAVTLPDVPTIANELYDLEGEGPPLADAQHIARVSGILTYFYGFHISPRSPADFEISK